MFLCTVAALHNPEINTSSTLLCCMVMGLGRGHWYIWWRCLHHWMFLLFVCFSCPWTPGPLFPPFPFVVCLLRNGGLFPGQGSTLHISRSSFCLRVSHRSEHSSALLVHLRNCYFQTACFFFPSLILFYHILFFYCGVGGASDSFHIFRFITK